MWISSSGNHVIFGIDCTPHATAFLHIRSSHQKVLPCKPSAQLIRSFGHPATKPYGNSRADAGRGSSNLKKKQGKTKCETRLKLCSSCKSPGHSFADNLIASVHVQGMGNPYENKYFQIALRLNRHSGETEPMRNCASN